MSRRRWLFTLDGQPLKEPIEVSDDWRDNHAQRTGDGLKFELDNLRTTDGVDISSKTKLDRYMKANGVCLASDYKETGEKARKAREATFSPEYQRRERKEAVGRAMYQLRQKRR